VTAKTTNPEVCISWLVLAGTEADIQHSDRRKQQKEPSNGSLSSMLNKLWYFVSSSL